ncbi:MAG: hypothetical protein VB106_18525 [Clostridiaceae bacterium]|jgi:hypothetical protein|nr:hypothetical protein [Clostridiaceae bacterium]
MKKLLIVILVVVALSLAACQATDVIARFAVTSFEAVLNKNPDSITADEANNGWSLTSPTGERFVWGKDFSTEGVPDVMLEFDSEPFIKAGLDVNKLPEDIYLYDSSANKLMIRSELGSEKFTYNGEAKPLDSFKKIVETHRDNIGYHAALDHYGVELGSGNMFEWAKDMDTNDKDIVFVLDPQPFIAAGADPDQVEGWTFAKVPVMDEQGKEVEVDKLLKPFDLK